MTINEAIKNREDCLKYLEEIGPKTSLDCLEAVRWSVKALKSLRPVSRERVEKVWSGCPGCDSVSSKWEIKFCPFCGKPRTDEAVQMVMERLEELKDGSTPD